MGTSQKARRGNRAVQDNPESGMASQSFKKGNVSYVTGKSRKRVSTESHYAPSNASAPTVNPSTAQSPPSKKLKGDKKIQESEAPFERRLRRWRAHPPKTYLERLFRIQHTRMFIVDQRLDGTEDVPEMSFEVVGSTGNLYRTTIKKDPQCDCPDGMKGNQCKHICYVLLHVLKAPAELQYQLAFLSSELREIKASAPVSWNNEGLPPAENNKGNRKPIEGDCPVCYQEMVESQEAIVWCKASCGNNLHKECQDKWAATTGRTSDVRCVYCRSIWESDTPNLNAESIQSLRGNVGNLNHEGYVNLASQFGLSGKRDLSVYSSFSTVHPYSSWRFGNRRSWR
ncbi:hypothetical protein PENSTE_c012G09096 [Penicillium steckii]|uniref:SWIM-type domain-containing protein n=1 Tax=Penicillium steckii TaxID=303698 RepID=A0A1V6T488_9EURO|nr:hypothetical protein PENSTE_c012G09096 [Penicillium steckii]